MQLSTFSGLNFYNHLKCFCDCIVRLIIMTCLPRERMTVSSILRKVVVEKYRSKIGFLFTLNKQNCQVKKINILNQHVDFKLSIPIQTFLRSCIFEFAMSVN